MTAQRATRKLRLALQGGMTIELGARTAWVLGHAGASSIAVDVDLTPYGARNAGVSRRHARITHTEEGFGIEDLGSTNETGLNSERLAPGQIYPLAHGDQVTLGTWRCTFLCE
jgi:hypothetical protein